MCVSQMAAATSLALVVNILLVHVVVAAGGGVAAGQWPMRPVRPHRVPLLDAHAFGCVPDNSTDNRFAIAKAIARK